MSDKQSVSLRDTKMAKAMAHPVRVQALGILNQKVASPSDIAGELGLPVANVAYHVRALLQLGCIEEVETRPVRGALEHRYRAIRRPLLAPLEWESLPVPAREGMIGVWFEKTFGDVAAAMAGGVFEHPDSHLSRTPLRLDAEGRTKLNAMLDEVMDAAMKLQAECAMRIADGAEEVTTRLALIHHDAAPSEPAAG